MLKKALPGQRVKHSHIAYLRKDGTGITSKNDGHEHEITLQEQVSPIADEFGNVVDQQVSMQPVVVPVDDHSHELGEIEIKEVKEKVYSEEEDLEESFDLYETAMKLEDDWYEEAKNDDEFYKGNQWSSDDAASLKENNRTMLVLNEIKPKIDVLIGHQKQNRTDMKLMPNEEGDQRISDIHNFRIKNVCARENYIYKESAAVEDALITGRGGLQVDVENGRNITGDIKIKKRSWDDVFFGEHSELDASDAEYGGVHIWYSMAQLKKLYPDHADEIDVDYRLRNTSYNVEPSDAREYHKRKKHLNVALMKKQTGTVNLATKKYRLIELQRKIYKKVPVLFDASNNFYFNAAGMNKSDYEKAKSIEELNYTDDTKHKIRRVTFAGSVVFSRRESVFSEINIVPVYCYKRDYDIWGKVRDAKDPQRELNKRSSQFIDVINFNTRYNTLFSAEAFETTADYHQWLERCNDPTFVPRLKEGFQNQYVQLQGIRNPTEIAASISLSREGISRVMNVNEALLGQQGSSASGAALRETVRQGLLGNEIIFDNLSLSKVKITKLLVEAIHLVDSPEKLLRLTESASNFKDIVNDADDLYPPMQIEEKMQALAQSGMLPPDQIQMVFQALQQGQQIPELEPIFAQIEQQRNDGIRQELLEMLRNDDLMNYDAVVMESPYSPNTMFSNFVMMSEMASKGVPIPPDQLIMMWPGLSGDQKNKMISSMSQQSQSDAQQETTKIEKQGEMNIALEQVKQKNQSGQAGVQQGFA